MRPNAAKQRLLAGQPAIGIFVSANSPLVAEAVGQTGLAWVCVDMQHGEANLGTLSPLHHSSTLLFGPSLSFDGTIAVLASTERSGKMQFSALAIDTSGGTIAELWDGPEASVEPGSFAPIAGITKEGMNSPVLAIAILLIGIGFFASFAVLFRLT